MTIGGRQTSSVTYRVGLAVLLLMIVRHAEVFAQGVLLDIRVLQR